MNRTNKISLNIIALFSVVILTSFIPEFFPKFFGDRICDGAWIVGEKYSPESYLTGCRDGGVHSATTHWGYRHWIYFLMGCTLFCIQIGRIFSFKEEPNQKESLSSCEKCSLPKHPVYGARCLYSDCPNKN